MKRVIGVSADKLLSRLAIYKIFIAVQMYFLHFGHFNFRFSLLNGTLTF
jgi:hypothetical protein